MANGTDDEQSRATRERAQTAIRHQLGQYTPGEIRGLNLHPEVNPNLPVNLAIRASEALKARDRVEQGQAATATFPQQREGPGVILGRTGAAPPGSVVPAAQGGGFTAPVAPAVDTDALIGQAIQGRQQIESQRSGIDARRSALIHELGTIRQTGKGVSPRVTAIRAELGQLHDQGQLLSGQERELHENLALTTQGAFRNASMAHRLATDALSQKTATEAGEVFMRSTEILNKYKPGTPEFHDAMVDLKDKYPLGFAAEASKGHLGKIAAFHDQEVDRVQKAAAGDLAKVGLTPEEFLTRTGERRGKIDPTTREFTNAYKEARKGDTYAFEVGGQTYITSKDVYKKLNKVFPVQTSPIQKSSAAPAAAAAPTEDTGDVNAAIREGRIVASPERTAQAAGTSAPQAATAPAAVPTATPHPMEGNTVRSKQTGQLGTIVNGQFVPQGQ